MSSNDSCDSVPVTCFLCGDERGGNTLFYSCPICDTWSHQECYQELISLSRVENDDMRRWIYKGYMAYCKCDNHISRFANFHDSDIGHIKTLTEQMKNYYNIWPTEDECTVAFLKNHKSISNSIVYLLNNLGLE